MVDAARHFCVLVKMPFHLAVFGINQSDKVRVRTLDIQQWYVGGHSLGSAMASSYAETHAGGVVGLILLGAHPVHTIDQRTIAQYGSGDRILNWERLSGVKNVIEIPGGNHAWFGNYGEQAGDGQAKIIHERQQEKAADAICAFMGICFGRFA